MTRVFSYLLPTLTFILFCNVTSLFSQHIEGNGQIALVIHGGAGTILKENMTEEKEAAIRGTMVQALESGYAVLEKGGSSTQAVIAAIKILENSPYFNAGKGAVFTAEGSNELDASIMEGKTSNAGAVTGVKTIKNPIEAAYEVMINSEHVMLSGTGAELFAKKQNLEIVSPEYFKTEDRREQLKRAKSSKHGTVGAVALDRFGNIAAGTSTGGMTNKKYGRIGDSPIIGAGTYADNNTCGVSCTGHGEFFIRYNVAYDVVAKMKYAQMTLKEATHKTVNEELKSVGGSGGLIALDAQGNISMVMNTVGMYRGYIQNGKAVTLIYMEE